MDPEEFARQEQMAKISKFHGSMTDASAHPTASMQLSAIVNSQDNGRDVRESTVNQPMTGEEKRMLFKNKSTVSFAEDDEAATPMLVQNPYYEPYKSEVLSDPTLVEA